MRCSHRVTCAICHPSPLTVASTMLSLVAMSHVVHSAAASAHTPSSSPYLSTSILPPFVVIWPMTARTATPRFARLPGVRPTYRAPRPSAGRQRSGRRTAAAAPLWLRRRAGKQTRVGAPPLRAHSLHIRSFRAGATASARPRPSRPRPGPGPRASPPRARRPRPSPSWCSRCAASRPTAGRG